MTQSIKIEWKDAANALTKLYPREKGEDDDDDPAESGSFFNYFEHEDDPFEVSLYFNKFDKLADELVLFSDWTQHNQ